MGDKKGNRWRIIGIVCIVFIILDFLRFQLGPTKYLTPQPDTKPRPDPSRVVKDWNWEKNEWEYWDQDTDRAKASKRNQNDSRYNREDYYPDEAESDDEDYIQEYLEENIDGYKEDTYWGNEYDINNKKK